MSLSNDAFDMYPPQPKIIYDMTDNVGLVSYLVIQFRFGYVFECKIQNKDNKQRAHSMPTVC